MTNNEYDLIVIGAGSTAAGNAAGLGKRVALIERDKLGGTCLNYGCDPTKTLLHTASVLYHARHASALGLCIPQAEADWVAEWSASLWPWKSFRFIWQLTMKKQSVLKDVWQK